MGTEDRENLLVKLGIVAPKSGRDTSAEHKQAPTPKKTVARKPTSDKRVVIESKTPSDNRTAIESKVPSDDISMEYQDIIKKRTERKKAANEMQQSSQPEMPKKNLTPTPIPNIKPTTFTSNEEPIMEDKAIEYEPAPYATEAYTIPETYTYEEPKYSQPPKKTIAPEQVSYYNTESYNSIGDLYYQFGKDTNGMNTIFIVDEFLRSLPSTLTESTKYDSVLNILRVSKINVDSLRSDGTARVDILNNFASTFTDYTNQVISTREQQIAVLEDQIRVLKREIAERNRLHDRQLSAVDSELQKIRTALKIISPDENINE